ncbi:hypothetical protein, partial [Stieleria sp.]|uniref:hypothetical protein n=1 Tax=Stieleria sp. TaxID=2795976 RepID=UPI00356784F3
WFTFDIPSSRKFTEPPVHICQNWNPSEIHSGRSFWGPDGSLDQNTTPSSESAQVTGRDMAGVRSGIFDDTVEFPDAPFRLFFVDF